MTVIDVLGTAAALPAARKLTVDGAAVAAGQGEMYVVPAGVPHAVRAGSRGSLMALAADEE